MKFKICCIQNEAEALLAQAYGATALGFVSKMPSGPGVIPESLIAEIINTLPDTVLSVLLTSETSSSAIIQQLKFVKTKAVQFVDEIQNIEYQKLKDVLPDIYIIQVLHVTGLSTVEQAIEKAEFVDVLLLDSGNPALKTKELGGTGRTHNWQISRQIRKRIKIPVYLAGGLRPDNIKKAVETVEPYGIDVCSGIRTNGLLDEQKLSRFIREISSYL